MSHLVSTRAQQLDLVDSTSQAYGESRNSRQSRLNHAVVPTYRQSNHAIVPGIWRILARTQSKSKYSSNVSCYKPVLEYGVSPSVLGGTGVGRASARVSRIEDEDFGILFAFNWIDDIVDSATRDQGFLVLGTGAGIRGFRLARFDGFDLR
eukprot:547376-Amorphochlora_amoeboformis.AAC.1